MLRVGSICGPPNDEVDSTMDLAKRLARHKLSLLGLVLIAILLVVACLAPLISPWDPQFQNLQARRLPPSPEHFLGTDELGRDLLSRLIHGARVSLLVGVLSVAFAMAVGVPLGLSAGYLGKHYDHLIMRAMDVTLAFPRILLAILLVAVLGPGLWKMVLAVGIWTIPVFARTVRSKTLSLKERDFVLAAQALGASGTRTMFRHILPNCLSPLLVEATLNIGTAILTESTLSFLGLGIGPGTPTWGLILSGGRAYLRDAPHISTFPGLAIMFTVLAFNFVGDGLRDVLDPRRNRLRGA